MSVSGIGTVSGTGYGFGQATSVEGRGMGAGRGEVEGTGLVLYRDGDGRVRVKVGSGSAEGRGIAIGFGSGSGNGGVYGTGTASGTGFACSTAGTDATPTTNQTDTTEWSEPVAVDGEVTYTTQSGEWDITINDTGSVTFTNTITGATVESWGDPHVNENGEHVFDYHTDSVVALPNSDGSFTYVHIDNEAVDGTAGSPTYTTSVTIADPNPDGSYSLLSTGDSNLTADGGLTLSYGTSSANPLEQPDDAPIVTISTDGNVLTRRGEDVDQARVDRYEARSV